MNDHELTAVADSALRPLLAPLGMEHVAVVPGRDHDGEDSLFVTAHYRRETKAPPGKVLLQALGDLRRSFLNVGEERFPYLDHRFGDDDQGFEEDLGRNEKGGSQA